MTVPERTWTLRTWTADPLSPVVRKSLERLARSKDVCHVAVMPDVHLAEDVCVGTVLATTRLIYPAAVGGDIGCGMLTARIDADAGRVTDELSAARLLAGLYRYVPGNRHVPATLPARLPETLADMPLSAPHLEVLKRRDGRVQLGTLGRGNHFLEFQADQEDRLWVLIHSGSRAAGQAITKHHLQRARLSAVGLACLDAQSREGQNYLADAAWAEQYAEHNRLAMLSAVESLLDELFGVKLERATLIHTQHNHVWSEQHGDTPYWVHRKGAQPAWPGVAGIVPGSMGAATFHVTGRGCAEALCSCSHGAGRRISRGEARRVVSERRFREQVQGLWFDHRRSRSLLDEAPAVYKEIRTVMRSQRDLVRIECELRPVLSYKG